MSASPDPSTMNPRKSARQGRSTATVEAIVEAAARILETAGLAGFTTNAIAERAGVSVGSLYQYFPNKDSITRALIRREWEAIEAALIAPDGDAGTTGGVGRFIAVAVEQQLRRPALAQLLEIEEDRLGAAGDIDPVRERVGAALAQVLSASGAPAAADVVQDVIALIATLVNVAASRGERDTGPLVTRIEAVVAARLAVA